MSALSPGKIFLADDRGITRTAGSQRLSTFNFGSYYNEHKIPFGSLYAFNDEILLGMQSSETIIDTASYIIIIPITGALNYRVDNGKTGGIDAGEILVLAAQANAKLTVTNPYDGDHINYLQIHIDAEEGELSNILQTYHFDLETTPDHLVDVVSAQVDELPFSVSIGRFGGRAEALYNTPKNSKIFAFVLAGAFEMQGRLLHERDGLALWGTQEVDMEALSNNALMLIIELPATA